MLLNYGSCFSTWWEGREVFWAWQQAHPTEPFDFPEFRSTFPAFYFINNFEYSLMFSPESNPAERLVVGPPGSFETEGYGKPLGPEAFTSTPYCPFKMDVFQLGWTFSGLFGVFNFTHWEIHTLISMEFQNITVLGPEFNQLVASMIAVEIGRVHV